MISLALASKSFGSTPILRDIQLSVPKGKTVAILGPSGIGKSTLLRIIAGLDHDYDGHVDCASKIGIVFQEPNLLPWRSTLNNLTLFHPTLDASTVRSMLTRLGLGGHADHFPGQLSLGQQRRLSIARAFLGQPDVLIMDEPFTSLDADLREDMLNITENLLTETRPATLLVTHDRTEANRLAHRTFTLSGSPASLQEGG